MSDPNDETNPGERPAQLPLWRSLAKEMIAAGISYEQTWPVSFFENGLRCSRDHPDFKFAMMNLRRFIEDEEGVYLRSVEDGAMILVPPAPEHDTIATTMDKKVRRYAVRSINIRSATLQNPDAELTPEQRKKMESNLEHASIRLVLMSRATPFCDLAKQHAPELLNRFNP